jgi:hypothetical protein
VHILNVVDHAEVENVKFNLIFFPSLSQADE